jgi:hypothetical protein
VDYYLVRSRDVDGVLVEEFARARDHSTVGLYGAVWTLDAARWRSSAAFGRAMRSDPELLAGVTPVDRSAAEAVYRRLGGGTLPSEADLRARFVDFEPFATAPPLRLDPAGVPDGFHDRRVYRVLFAKTLDARQLDELRAAWRVAPGGDAGGSRQIGGDLFTWTLRRVGRGIAWALDVTVLLASTVDDTVGPVLHELTAALRERGLVPVTTERFA